MKHTNAYRIIEVPEKDAIVLKFIFDDGNFYGVTEQLYIRGGLVSINPIRMGEYVKYEDAVKDLNNTRLDSIYKSMVEMEFSEKYCQNRKARESLEKWEIELAIKIKAEEDEAKNQLIADKERKEKRSERNKRYYQSKKREV